MVLGLGSYKSHFLFFLLFKISFNWIESFILLISIPNFKKIFEIHYLECFIPNKILPNGAFYGNGMFNEASRVRDYILG